MSALRMREVEEADTVSRERGHDLSIYAQNPRSPIALVDLIWHIALFVVGRHGSRVIRQDLYVCDSTFPTAYGQDI